MLEVIAAENFDEEILDCPIPVVVDFYADWCNPCKMIAPILEEIELESEELLGQTVRIVKHDVGVESKIAAEYAVRNVPTMLVFVGGAVVGRMSGAQSKAKIVEFINESL